MTSHGEKKKTRHVFTHASLRQEEGLSRALRVGVAVLAAGVFLGPVLLAQSEAITGVIEGNIGFQFNYTYSKDRSDDDNERDPFQFTYAKANDLGPEYGYSNRDQRHRLNTWLLYKGPAEVLFNARYTYLSAQPKSITATGADAETPQDRINPDGSVTQRNLGRKDNQYSSLDLRFSRVFSIAQNVSIEPGVDIFNVFNSKNLRRPQVTNLIFNFDGTVQEGVGSPRQIQVGARVSF